MRSLTSLETLESLMRGLGRAASRAARVYLTGGACAVLLGWRQTTLDVDLTFAPEDDAIFRAIATLKDRLQVNVEVASPAHFIPEVPGWQERSAFIAQHGSLAFHHYDFYSQALAKLERGHAQDRDDVRSMRAAGLVLPSELWRLFEIIEPSLIRYPAIDPPSFRAAVEAYVRADSPA